jgi:hypothetical protein
LQPVNATGKTIASLRSIVGPDRLQYLGRGFMEALERGRGPRKSGSYGNFDTNLEEWLRAKGFPSKKTKSGKTYYQIGSQWFSAKSLAWKINRNGDKTFRSGQVKDIYSKAMEEFVEELKEAITEDKKNEFSKKVLQVWH